MTSDYPTGQTRVSDAVIDATTTIAAGGVRGVLSVESLAGGAALGASLGASFGALQAGPLGAAVGGSAGAAVGAAAGAALRDRQRQRAFLDVHADGVAPDVHIAISARYGEDLRALADCVRDEVEGALVDVLGLRPGRVSVEIVDVVSPEAQHDAEHPTETDR